MVCKVWSITAVTMKNAVFWDIKPVHTSQETHYISDSEPSRLMLCKIWGFYGGDYEGCRHLGCDAVYLLKEPTFRGNVSTSIIRVERTSELGTSSVSSNCWLSYQILSTLMIGTIRSSETLVLTRATRRHIPEDGILHNRQCTLVVFTLILWRVLNKGLWHMVQRNLFIQKMLRFMYLVKIPWNLPS
jgi:hypothetical protein